MGGGEVGGVGGGVGGDVGGGVGGGGLTFLVGTGVGLGDVGPGLVVTTAVGATLFLATGSVLDADTLEDEGPFGLGVALSLGASGATLVAAGEGRSSWAVGGGGS